VGPRVALTFKVGLLCQLDTVYPGVGSEMYTNIQEFSPNRK